MKKTIVTISCDRCQEDITEEDYGECEGKHYCKPCLTKLFKVIESAYMRVIKGQVKDRRKKWRTLGDFADT